MGKRQISKLTKAIKQNPKEKKYPTPGLIPFINKEEDKVASSKEKQLRINLHSLSTNNTHLYIL